MCALNIDPANPKGNPSATELRDLGIKAVRFSYKDFSGGNQPDPAQVQFYTNRVETLANADISPTIIFTYQTYPGAPSGTASDQVWDEYINHFAQRAGQIAQVFTPWRPAFQIWNEPDLPPHPEYIRTMREAAFGRMLRRCYEAIKAVDSNLRVVAAGLGSGNPSWLRTVIQHENGRLPADAFAIHPYGQRPEPNWPNPNWGFGYVNDLIANYKQVTNLPLIISEIGVEHLPPEGQAEYLRRFYNSVLPQFSSVMKDVFWFCYSDGMVPPFGLLDQSDQRKPAYYAYRDVAFATHPPEPEDSRLMKITAIVNKADYDNMVRTYWEKDDIDADLEVDGVLYEKGEIAFRGTSSLNFPKKGFKIKFRKKELFQGNTKRIDLSASYVDKSLIRERLSFDLFAKTSVVASKAWHVSFTIRSKEGQILERGLFTAIEHVDKYFFRNRDREIGALYKGDGGAVNGVFMGAVLDPQPDEVLKILYDKKNAKKIVAEGLMVNLVQMALSLPPIEIADADEEDYSDLTSFIQTINSWDAGNISQHLDDYVDVESYLDWLAVNTLVQSNDTYHKNYFLHNRVEDDKWEILPWDYDLTWGRNWNDYCDGLCDDLSEGTSIKGSAQMTNRLSQRVLNNPTYFERLRVKLADLLSSEFTEAKLFRQIDTYYDEITQLAHMDTRKWPTDEEFDRERDRLKDWVRRRRRFLLKEVGTPPPSVRQADTIVIAVGFNKATLIDGDQIAFEATVQNIGSAITGDTVGVAFLVDGKYITFGTSAPLEPGASRLIKSVSSWPAVAGEHTLTAVVDDINRYPELSETNNTLEIKFQVEPKSAPIGLSDVVIKDIAFEELASGRIRLAALVANIGQVETPDQVGVAFFVDDKYATFGISAPLKAGESRAVRADQTLSLIGQHKITAIADDTNRFPEESEQNNVLSRQIEFGTPSEQLADTIILDVTMGSGRFSEGDKLTFEAMVKNIGTAPTRDLVGVAFFIDGQYITFGTTPAIEPGITKNIRAVSTWRAVAGQHQLIAVVDDINRYPEISETNNTFETSFHVFKREEVTLPDSTVDGIDFETDQSGQVVLTATVSNIGGVRTPDIVGVAFFVDGQYAVFGITEPMDAGTTKIIRAVKPLSLQGTHKITAIVDDINRYDEVSHQNNALEQEISFFLRQS
jgi:spore coat protein H